MKIFAVLCTIIACAGCIVNPPMNCHGYHHECHSPHVMGCHPYHPCQPMIIWGPGCTPPSSADPK